MEHPQSTNPRNSKPGRISQFEASDQPGGESLVGSGFEAETQANTRTAVPVTIFRSSRELGMRDICIANRDVPIEDPRHRLQTLSNAPFTVKEAARFLGVSPQTVYLWVERKQIPHLRVMGRNIRFLKSDLEPFRAQFKQEVANGKTA